MKVNDEYWSIIPVWNSDLPKNATIEHKKFCCNGYINQVLKRVVLITKTGHAWEYVLK